MKGPDVARARRAVESSLRDRGELWRDPGGTTDVVPDPVTLRPSADTGATKYWSGPCLITTNGPTAAGEPGAAAVGAAIELHTYRVKLPASVPLPVKGDHFVLSTLASFGTDPALVGRRLRIVNVVEPGMLVARSIDVVEELRG